MEYVKHSQSSPNKDNNKEIGGLFTAINNGRGNKEEEKAEYKDIKLEIKRWEVEVKSWRWEFKGRLNYMPKVQQSVEYAKRN